MPASGSVGRKNDGSYRNSSPPNALDSGARRSCLDFADDRNETRQQRLEDHLFQGSEAVLGARRRVGRRRIGCRVCRGSCGSICRCGCSGRRISGCGSSITGGSRGRGIGRGWIAHGCVSLKGGCGKLYACLTRRCRRCLRCGRGRGLGQLCAHGVHPGMKIACQDRVDLADRVAHDGAEKCRGRGVAEVDVAQERGEGEEEEPRGLNERNGMRDDVFASRPALERGLRLERVDRRRDVGELAMPLDRLEAGLEPRRFLVAHLPGGCAWRAISMQRSANFSIIAVRCAIWLLRNHITMPRKKMLISTSSRNAGGSAEISFSLVRASWPTRP